MPTTSIAPSTLAFLRELRKNNNRDWFNDHKDRYREEHAKMLDFAETLIARMSTHDQLEPMTGKQSLFRIYRDVRFSKDKSPYKVNFAGQLKRATKWRRGGYYYHIEPGNGFLGGGFWAPNSADLKRIRQELAADAEPVRKILASKEFRHYFGELQGEQLKTAPQGYSVDHPNIDLLRYKQFLLTRPFTDKEMTDPGFLDDVVVTFQAMRPFFDYMSEVLTTDENGVPIE